MKFSVLIPLYNAEKYISQCIDSVLLQDFEDYEIVIVDDGSTDKSGDIADNYQEHYPQKIRVIHKENTGVLLTRRRALQEAKGEYILWVDSDDMIKSNLMGVMAEHIDKFKSDIIIYNYEWMNSPEKVIRSLDFDSDKQNIDKHLIYTKLILGRDLNELVTKCIRREIIDIDADYTDYIHVRMGDDMFCLIPIFDAAEKIEFVNDSFYLYRVVSSSITHTTDYNNYFSYRTIYERIDAFLNKWNFNEKELIKARSVFSVKIIDCIMNCISSGVNKREYNAFVRKTAEDERNRPICLEYKKYIENPIMRYGYGLWKAGMFDMLYYYGKTVISISRRKHKLFERDKVCR